MNHAAHGSFPVASAHGRFQPLHNDHLEYLLEAKRRGTFLWIGITQYIVSNLVAAHGADVHRSRPFDNPLTYFERAAIVREALAENGVSYDEFGIVPFPVETPSLLPEFVPLDIPVLTTIRDDWNVKKIAVLRGVGYRVEVLWNRRVAGVSGSEIRRQIIEGDEDYTKVVPAATVRAIDRLDLRGRLKRLSKPVQP